MKLAFRRTAPCRFLIAHLCDIFREAYLDSLNMSVTEFARAIGTSRKCASDYVIKHAGTSFEMAHLLAKATDTTVESWLLMQVKFSLWKTKQARVSDHIHVLQLSLGHE